MADNNLNISVVIAGRPYKLKVTPEEEVIARQAAREINEKVQNYQDQFYSKDKQDFLAMIALQQRVDALKGTSAAESEAWLKKMEELESLLDQNLTK
jgi:cell division protein ZapA (FtsZ GTPase activity inhibitor)